MLPAAEVEKFKEEVYAPLNRYAENVGKTTQPDVNPEYIRPNMFMMRLQKIMDEYAGGVGAQFTTSQKLCERGLELLIPQWNVADVMELDAPPRNSLEKALRMIGEMPGVEGVHVLAHSRGGGLTMDALSALGNEYQLRGEAFFSALPLRNVVLLSPDLDADIAAHSASASACPRASPWRPVAGPATAPTTSGRPRIPNRG